VKVAEERTTEAGASAPRATSDGTVISRSVARRIASQSRGTKKPTPNSTPSGASKETAVDDSALPVTTTSKNSEKPRKGSNVRWRTPRNVRELAGQANEVATMLLNGEIDPEVGARYGSLVRGIAQMMSIEVTRARFVKTEPILTLSGPTPDIVLHEE